MNNARGPAIRIFGSLKAFHAALHCAEPGDGDFGVDLQNYSIIIIYLMPIS